MENEVQILGASSDVFADQSAPPQIKRSMNKAVMETYRNSPQEQERIGDLMRILPKGLNSILDVGARDGYLSRLLTQHFTSVTALDLEEPAIAHERITCVKGNAAQLEFPDGTFDVILCAEVLEHLSNEVLEKACRELIRVATSYVVIGVPYRQDLRWARSTCQTCGGHNPPWGHIQIFDEQRLARLFHPLRNVATTFIGSTCSRTNAFSTWLMDVAGNPWGNYEQEEPCIHCGQALGAPAKQNLAQKTCSWLACSLNNFQARFTPARPSWIHMVFEKGRPDI